MRKATILGTIVLFVAGLFSTFDTADAAARVRSYFRSNGTYVQSYYRSNVDSYKWNNYSSWGN